MAMGGVHDGAEIIRRAERGLDRRPVPGPVAVVPVGLAGALVDAGVNLLDERGHPDGVHAETVEVAFLDPPQHALEVTALEVAKHPPSRARPRAPSLVESPFRKRSVSRK